MSAQDDGPRRIREFLSSWREPGVEDAPAPDAGGRRLGKYRILGQVGRGGMGTVYEAQDTELQRRVALKVLKDEEAGSAVVARLHLEGKILAQLRHPNIVPVFEVGIVDHPAGPSTHFIAMPFIEGRTVAEVLRERPLDRTRLLAMLEQIAQAVAYAHAQGVIHRDIKPSNVLIDWEGGVFLTDFGLARTEVGRLDLTKTEMVMGTPLYMAPEQVRGRAKELDARTDVYALGVMLYEILAGRPPFSGETASELYSRILNEEPTRPGRHGAPVAGDLEIICLKAMEKDPSRRYPGAGEFAEDLARFGRGEPILARPPSLFYRIRKRVVKRRIPLAVAAGGLAIAVAAWWTVSGLRDRKERGVKEALALLEEGRAAIDRATQAQYIADSDYAEALRGVGAGRAKIEEAIRRAPDLANGPHLLGLAWELEGWEDRAGEAWRRTLAIDPSFAAARLRLARMTALVACREAIDRTGTSPRRQSSVTAAIVELDRSLKAGGDDRLQRCLLESLKAFVQGEDPATLAPRLREGIAEFKGREGVEDLHWLLGVVSDGPGRLAAYDAAILRRPKFALALACRAYEHQSKRRFDAAIRDAGEALSVNPRLTLALGVLGIIHSLKSEDERAVGYFDRLLEVDPSASLMLTNRAICLHRLGRLPEALRNANTAIEMDPDYAPAYALRATCRSAGGDVEGALKDATRSLELDGRNYRTLWLRGNQHAKREDWAAAESDFARALELVPPGDADEAPLKTLLDHVRLKRSLHQEH